MEDHTTTDSTLRLYRRMVGRFPRIGVVLQARLHRTESDIRELAPFKPNVRLCLGIYREPPGIALQAAQHQGAAAAAAAHDVENGQYVGIATHDEQVIQRALALAASMRRTSGAVRVPDAAGSSTDGHPGRVMARGLKMRLYVPYGEQWYHYCLRRLDNNPEMARMVVGNLLKKMAGR